MIEDTIIKLIKSLDRMWDNFDKLTLRRTLLIIYTIILFSQTILTTALWLFGKDISDTWLGILVVEHTSWAIMVSYYFKTRSKNNNGE